MATMLVCDIDGKPDAKTVTIEVEGKWYAKDLCEEHVAEILTGTREVARRGRPKGSTTKARSANGRQRRKKAS